VQCQELGIRVLSGAEGSVRNVLEQLREGSLKAASLETIGIQNDG